MRHVSRVVLLVCLGTLLAAGPVLADSTTFKVNLKVMQELGFFNPATQTLHVRGSFNGWGDGSDLADPDGDLIYVGSFDVGTTSPIKYKFVVKEGASVKAWEDNIGDRELALDGTHKVLGAVEWTDGIRFQVNMTNPINTGLFNPATQFVAVMGSFNGWAAGDSTVARRNELKDIGDKVYAANIPIGTSVGMEHKYTIHNNSDGKVATWEDHANRTLITTGMTLAKPTNVEIPWDGDPGVAVTGTVLFQVDITPLKDLGIFDETEGDTLQLRGEFNAWTDADPSVSIMRQSFLEPNIYEIPITLTRVPGVKQPYKFYIKFNPARPVWGGGSPINGWEEPASTGGGNRIMVFSGEPQQVLPVQTFNDIFTVIPQGVSVTMHFTADMRCFLRNPPGIPVDKATDTLRLDIQDEVWHFFNGTLKYNGASNLIGHGSTPFDFSDANGDSIYGLAVTTSGPIQNWVQYHLNWQGYDDKAPGFDLGRRRVRYVRSDAQGNYASDYEMGVDYISTETKPLLVEDPEGPTLDDVAPCAVTTRVERVDATVPESYALGQNYPNPFNPSTTFEYALLKGGRVTITLYNYLGQKIADLVNEEQPAGRYKVTVDLSELNRAGYASGVYFYQMKAGDFRGTRRMMLVK